MNKVLVLGATGALGFEVVKRLKEKNYYVRALSINEESAKDLHNLADDIFIADATKPETLKGICNNIDIIFSALGKSISMFSNDNSTFMDLDYQANKNVLDLAVKTRVSRFVYVSVYGSERHSDLEFMQAHQRFVHEIKISGLSYTIIKPVGLFSGLDDVLMMAKKGRLVTIGNGNYKTNPIHHADLAKICVDNMVTGKHNVGAGGPRTYTRKEIAEMACQVMNCKKNIYLPKWIVVLSLPFIKVWNKSTYQKFSFYNRVLTEDIVAPHYGTHLLEDYFRQRAEELNAAS